MATLTNWPLGRFTWIGTSRPRSDQTTFSRYLFLRSALKPRSWLTFDSDLRAIPSRRGTLICAQDRMTFQPNNTWSLTVGNFFLRSTPTLGQGNDLITSVFFYRFNENWGTRILHYFDAKTGTLEEQDYSIYRDSAVGRQQSRSACSRAPPPAPITVWHSHFRSRPLPGSVWGRIPLLPHRCWDIKIAWRPIFLLPKTDKPSQMRLHYEPTTISSNNRHRWRCRRI